MENLKIRCRSCGKELEGISGKIVSCGCPNMATIRNGVISAVDLSQVFMLNSYQNKKNLVFFPMKMFNGKKQGVNVK